MRSYLVCFLLLISVFGAITGRAADRYVSPPGGYGTNDTDGGYTNWLGAATNIQWAVNAAAAGESVWVTNGTYYLTNQVSIGSVITLKSVNGAAVTVINGNYPLYTNRCISATVAAIVDGFTITNGRLMTDWEDGAGLKMSSGGQVLNCIVSGNVRTTLGHAGGIAMSGSAGLVDHCIISGNSNYHLGGGLYLDGGSTMQYCEVVGNVALCGAGVESWNVGGYTIKNCVIASNWAPNVAGQTKYGAGVYMRGASCIIQDCLIFSNEFMAGAEGTKIGAGIYISQPMGRVQNCTVVRNNSSANGSGGGVYIAENATGHFVNVIIDQNYASSGAGVKFNNPTSTSTNSTFTNCALQARADIDGYAQTNSRCLFDTNLGFVNSNIFNFRLSSSSPCVNTGSNDDWMTNAVDMDGYNRIRGPSVDIGAYEYGYGSMTVAPSGITNMAIQGNTITVPFTIISSNYDLYWSAVVTSSWVSANAGHIDADSSGTVYFTNNSAGLLGTYQSTVKVVATNNPASGSTTNTVLMVLDVISMTASPTNLTNSAYTGHNATNQSFRVISAGSGSYTWHVTTNGSVSWLIVSNGVGSLTNSATNQVLLSYVSSSLSSGRRTGVLAVATSDGGGRTQEVSVVLNVIGLSVSPTNLNNSVLYGFNATSQTFGVSAGGADMTFTASTDAAWMSVSPSSGYSSGGMSNILTNIYLTTNLAAGDYRGQVIVRGMEGGGNTGVVGVSLSVLPRPVLNVSPAVITQVVDKGSNPTGEYFYVWNGSASPVVGMEYRVTTSTDTYGIIQGYSPSSGVSTGEHDAVGIYFNNLSGFTSGVYTAVVAVAATNYGTGYEGYWSGASNIAVVLVIAGPDAPGQISATKGDYEDRVAINWRPVLSPLGGSVTYSVLRHNTFDPSYAQAIVSGLTVTNYNDMTVSPGVKYYYWVRCANSYGQSGTNSAYDSGYRRLSAPAGLFASDGEYTNKVVTSWATVDGAGSYYVYRAEGGSAGMVYHTAGTEFEDNMVSEGVEYTYYVQATNSICGSVMSTGETGYVLSRPTVLSASDGQYVGSIALSWNAVHGATAYEVWRSTQTLLPPYGGGAQIAVKSATTYNDTSVTAGTKYYYWLKSRSATTVSGFSSREEGYAATASIDLSLWGLVVQPRRIGLGGYPDVISFRLANSGGSALTGDNGTVRLTFYASANSVMGDGDDVEIGTVDERLELGTGSSGIFRVAGGNIVMPGAEGSYYLFMRLAPVWPSTLAPTSAGGWVAQRSGAVELSSEGSINYQAMNDYDGDGVSDMVVHGSGIWDGRTSDGFEFARNYAFGGSGAVVMGDYDGDRKTDPVVYDESRGYWQALLSGGGYAYVTGWFGGPGYRGVPGDYDGDRKTEAAVYDIYNSMWYALKVGGGTVMWGLQFGAGYEPVIGDYDGDGVWDLAVYNEVNGAWYIRTVSGTLILSGERWGGPGFSPVPGDYDGDGLWDFAVYERAAGRWYIVNLHGEMIANGMLWGAGGYRPVGGDFDGDGLYDLAMYNMISGKWFIRTVSGTWIALDASWGGSGRTAVGEVE